MRDFLCDLQVYDAVCTNRKLTPSWSFDLIPRHTWPPCFLDLSPSLLQIASWIKWTGNDTHNSKTLNVTVLVFVMTLIFMARLLWPPGPYCFRALGSLQCQFLSSCWLARPLGFVWVFSLISISLVSMFFGNGSCQMTGHMVSGHVPLYIFILLIPVGILSSVGSEQGS